MKDINRIFEAIHDVYESHDGGVVCLDDNEKLLIKNQLIQLILVNKNHGVTSDVIICDCGGKSIETAKGIICYECELPK
tara:strand:- start:1274 stop:1510 length:237 start_codon:yes stop_codon:yes gene_type:complete